MTIQIDPSTSGLRVNSSNSILSRSFWRYRAKSCYSDVAIPAGLSCVHPDNYPFANFSLLYDGCTTPPQYLSLSGSYAGSEIKCHPVYERVGCYDSSLGGEPIVPYNETWKAACGYGDLEFVEETVAPNSYRTIITNIDGYIHPALYCADEYTCNMDCTSINPIIEIRTSIPNYYHPTLPEVKKKVPSEGISDEWYWPLCWNRTTLSYEDCLADIHYDYTDGFICFDDDLTLYVYCASLELYYITGEGENLTLVSCGGFMGTGSGAQIDDTTCLPYGTIITAFYNNNNQYIGELTYTMEIEACP